MLDYLRKIEREYNLSIGICATTNQEDIFKYNENLVFPAASLVKIPLCLLILKKYEQGLISLEEKIKIDNKVPGAGIVKDLTIEEYKIIDLITLSLIISDNTASNTLINLTNFQEINDFILSLGLKNTCIKRKFMVDLVSPPVNFTTAYECNQIFYKLLKFEILNAQNTLLFFDILSKQHYTEKIPSRIKKFPIIIANKTGDIEGISHDTAVLFLDQSIGKSIEKGNYLILTILTKFSKDFQREKVNNIISDISLNIYESLKGRSE